MMKWRFLVLVGLLVSATACTHWGASQSEIPSLTLKKVWVRPTEINHDFGFRKSVRMEPLIVGDRVIQGNGHDGIMAVGREKGEILWHIPVEGGVEGGATFADDYLFFGGNNGQFYSASIKTGQILWSAPIGTEVLSAPVLHKGMVYFITGNNVLHALDAMDGREIWIYSRVDSANFSIRGASVPAIKDGSLFLGFSDGFLVSLDAKSGAIQWEAPLNNRNKNFHDLDSAPIIDENYIYILGYDSYLYCVKAKTGELVWKTEPGGFGQVTLIKDKLFYSTSKGEVIAMNKNDGTIVWRYKVKSGIATSPRLFKNSVVFGESDGRLRLLSLSQGKEEASFDSGHGIESPIAVDEATSELYFLSRSAWLYKMKVNQKASAQSFSGGIW